MNHPFATMIAALALGLSCPVNAVESEEMAQLEEEAWAVRKRGGWEEAFPLYLRLAEMGSALNQELVAQLYNSGDAGLKSYAEAFRWHLRAAEQGLSEAQHNVGYSYEKGQGVPQNYAEAAKWYRRAAEQNYPGAQLALGNAFFFGRGVPQDYVKAHMWYNLAASHPWTEYENRTESYAKNRDAVAEKMTPAQIAEAQKLAREWKPKPE